ncbi:hypothetical protein BV25DRAFT_244512 [Artomyces pyxidatus]|uniref:Uncharacterized protein n=1 Tax=Artomyces pyxidatus TaxID=48021 RepID=A0ACB8T8M1_9AGAM|nr:hypothetical protein BV25DRAFT_244512 [Artomyces pyxidatus]
MTQMSVLSSCCGGSLARVRSPTSRLNRLKRRSTGTGIRNRSVQPGPPGPVLVLKPRYLERTSSWTSSFFSTARYSRFDQSIHYFYGPSLKCERSADTDIQV